MFKLQSQTKKGNGLKMAEFLKRRRIEMGIKLEDLSCGVCSPSYLSRIENNIVDVSEDYYKALCEKMNINYETVKVEREKNLYEDLLRAYFRINNVEIEAIVNHALASNSYCEIEIELMVLFYNIINNNYDEARRTLIRLDSVSNSLTNNELLFYMYAFALYAHKTNQNVKAYQQIMVLSKVEHNNALLDMAIYDLGVDIMMAIGNVALSYEYYHKFEKIAEMPIFGIRLHLHKLQLMTYTSSANYESALEQVELIKKNLNLTVPYIKEKYYYYLGIIMYINNDYEKLYNILVDNIISARIASLLMMTVKKINDHQLQKSLIEKLDKYCFTKYEKLYDNYYRYVKLIFEGNSSYVLYNYVKNVLLSEKIYYDGFLIMEIKKAYLEECEGCSKYKEGMRYIKQDWQDGMYKNLNNK